MKLLNKLQGKTTGLLQYKDLKGEFHHMELSGEAGTRMLYKGEEYISWSINNYLGLMNHPESIQIATEYTQKYGTSYPHAPRITVGQTKEHDNVEKELSSLLGFQDSMLVQLGYAGLFGY